MKQIKFQQSYLWSQSQTIEWIINNARFAFINNLHKGNRVRIVTCPYLGQYNCFEFDNDKYGIIICSESIFSYVNWKDNIVEQRNSREGIIQMLDIFYNEWGADQYINPKPSLKSFFNRIRGYHKIVTVNI
jgi:hypothetical protein